MGAVEFCFSDRGTELENEVLQNVCQILGIHKSCTTGYRPNSDGAVEKTQATISSIFAKTVKSHQKDWSDLVPYVTFAYNTAVHSVTKHTPFYLMFGRHPITGIDWQLEHPSPAEVQDVDMFSERMRERMRVAHELVAEQLKCAFLRNKTRYVARVKAIQFKSGDFVWFFSPRKKQGLSRTWQLMTVGSNKVVRTVNLVNYVIQKIPKSKPFICHIDRLRKFTGDIPRCWTADTANEVQPEVGNQGNSHPAYTTGRGPGPAVTLVTEDELSSGASAACAGSECAAPRLYFGPRRPDGTGTCGRGKNPATQKPPPSSIAETISRLAWQSLCSESVGE